MNNTEERVSKLYVPTSKDECGDCDRCVYHDHWGLIQCSQRDKFED